MVSYAVLPLITLAHKCSAIGLETSRKREGQYVQKRSTNLLDMQVSLRKFSITVSDRLLGEESCLSGACKTHHHAL